MEASENPSSYRPLLARIYISSSENRLRAGWRLIGQLVFMLVLLVCTTLSLGFMILAQAWVTGKKPIIQPIGLASTFGVTLAVTLSIFLARRILDRRSIISLGFKLHKQAFSDLLVGFGISGLMISLIFGLEIAFGWLHIEGYAWQNEPPDKIFINGLIMLGTFVLGGWQEELFSRGYQLQNLEDGLTTFWGVFLSSGMFAILHLGNPNSSWISTLGLFLAGLFLAYGYLTTRQLWLPIGLHIGWNFFEGTVFGFPVSGLSIYRLIIPSIDGPDLITGGAFGPEAGLIQIPVLLFGSTLIYLYTSRRKTIKPQESSIAPHTP